MQRIYTHALGNKVVRYHDGAQLAKIKDIIVNPENGKIEGLWIKENGFSLKDKVLPIRDIIEWKLNAYVNDENSLVNPKEVIRINEILKKNIKIYQNQVETKKGDYLGQVADFSFDNKSFYLQNLYVERKFLGLISYSKWIIPAKKIIEITKDKIIVDDNIERVKWRRKKLFSLKELLINMDPAINQTIKKLP